MLPRWGEPARSSPPIERPAARELIYETGLEAVTADVIVDEEVRFLQWLARTWHLPVRIELPSTDG